MNSSVEMRVDVGRHSPRLPGGEAAVHDFPRAPVKRWRNFWCPAAIPAKQCKRARDVGLGGLAVTVAHKGCRFHEPRGSLCEVATAVVVWDCDTSELCVHLVALLC